MISNNKTVMRAISIRSRKGRREMNTLKEWVKTASKEEITAMLLDLNDTFVSFDKYIREELGADTYNDIVREWALKRSQNWLREQGMDEASIERFAVEMGHEDPGEA